MNATALPSVEVLEIQETPTEAVLGTSCPDYDTYAALPKAVMYLGVAYGLTGWNSDTGRAYYKTTKKFATPLT